MTTTPTDLDGNPYTPIWGMEHGSRTAACLALLTEALSDTRTFLNGVVGWIDEAIGPVPVSRALSEPEEML